MYKSYVTKMPLEINIFKISTTYAKPQWVNRIQIPSLKLNDKLSEQGMDSQNKWAR